MSDQEQTQGKEIYIRLGRIMEEVSPISKDRENSQQRFKFRGIEDVMNSLHELFKKHGVVIATEIVNHEYHDIETKSGSKGYHHLSRVAFDLVCCADGSSHRITTLGEAMDYGDKGATKTLSIALKYALLNFFLIPTEETAKDDPDSQSHAFASAPEKPGVPAKWTDWRIPFRTSKRYDQTLAEIVMEGDTIEELMKIRKYLKDVADKQAGKPDYDYWLECVDFTSEAIEHARKSPDGDEASAPASEEVADEDVPF